MVKFTIQRVQVAGTGGELRCCSSSGLFRSDLRRLWLSSPMRTFTTTEHADDRVARRD